MDNKKPGTNKGCKPVGVGEVLKSIVILAATYCLLMAGWPLLGRVYSPLFRGCANLLYGSFGTHGVVKFTGACDEFFDTEVTLFNLGRKDSAGRVAGVRLPCSSRRCGYIDAAFLASLIIATPVAMQRKLWALLWGQLLIHCLTAAKLGVWLVDRFSREPLCLFQAGIFQGSGPRVFYEMFVLNVTFGFVAAVFIWILVTFRREDWARINSGKKSSLKKGTEYKSGLNVVPAAGR